MKSTLEKHKYIQIVTPIRRMDAPEKREKSLLLLSSLKGMACREPLLFPTPTDRSIFFKNLDTLILSILQCDLSPAAEEAAILLQYVEEHMQPSQVTAVGRILELVRAILSSLRTRPRGPHARGNGGRLPPRSPTAVSGPTHTSISNSNTQGNTMFRYPRHPSILPLRVPRSGVHYLPPGKVYGNTPQS